MTIDLTQVTTSLSGTELAASTNANLAGQGCSEKNTVVMRKDSMSSLDSADDDDLALPKFSFKARTRKRIKPFPMGTTL
ncbi:hypothetical protein Hypma_010840 [Hypsizygus marmoreus]|uniref:Uncharacterized protein n=1 Tax=Hypsizygus marmoreus TaxID=39966 RepID=A0A369JI82_HYPMA|nr:hypothetical protein Hypma_010840 [Hypsizygus marmoreus]